MRVLISGLVACLAFAPSAVSAETPLASEERPQYRLTVMSWWGIPFRSVVRQQHDFSCGSAAVATLLTYHYGHPTTESATFARMWETGDQKLIRKVGFSMLDMKSYLSSAGFRAEGLRLGQEGLDKLKRPAIVLLNLKGFKHFVVVKGVQNGRVLVGDPALGLKQYDESEFLKAWNGIALVVVRSDVTPAFNRVADWSPWSTAPLRDGAASIAADNFLAHLPPTYQLAPMIFVDAHVGTVP
jgi:uncharacterized protein